MHNQNSMFIYFHNFNRQLVVMVRNEVEELFFLRYKDATFYIPIGQFLLCLFYIHSLVLVEVFKCSVGNSLRINVMFTYFENSLHLEVSFLKL